MSYPQFNLTTLQLPAPASNMTKAEYKAAYGIDLDQVDIKAFKLVLLAKDKYPIDQIKEVEEGYEIYFNGRILSITDIVQTSDEVYDVANSKPLYFHPVIVSGNNVKISMIIIDNSPAEYNTPTVLINKLKAFNPSGIARIPLSGCVINEEKFYIASHLDVSAATTTNILRFYGGNVTDSEIGVTVINTFETLLANTSVYDGVNKIN